MITQPFRLLAALLLSLLAAGCVVAPVGEATVSGDYGDTRVQLRVSSYPDLALVPGLPVYYAPTLGYNYFFYDGLYWVLEGDNWYASHWYGGPWRYVQVSYVPVYVLRVPVYYYRRPPAYFRHWHRHEPPRWGERYGRDWEARHAGWRHWDPRAVPPPAPRPDYQRRYRGRDYPASSVQQRELRERFYRYEPREPAAWREAGAGRPVREDRPGRVTAPPAAADWQQRQQEWLQQRDAGRVREREQQAREREAAARSRQEREAAAGDSLQREARERQQRDWQRPESAARPVREWRGEWRGQAPAPRRPDAEDAAPAWGSAAPERLPRRPDVQPPRRVAPPPQDQDGWRGQGEDGERLRERGPLPPQRALPRRSVQERPAGVPPRPREPQRGEGDAAGKGAGKAAGKGSREAVDESRPPHRRRGGEADGPY